MSRNAGSPRHKNLTTCAADLVTDVLPPGRKVHIDHMNWFSPYCLDHCGALPRLSNFMSQVSLA